LKKKIISYAVGLVILLGVSIFCNLLAFYSSGLSAWFLPVSIAVILSFLLFSGKVGVISLLPSRFIRCLSSTTFFYSIGMFLFPFICMLLLFFDFNLSSDKLRFPLSQIHWISVDEKGTFYCLSSTCSRLQVFDSQGKFIRGWFVRRPGGAYQVSLSKSGDVVLGKDGKAYYAYDKYGNRKSPEEENCKSFNDIYSRQTTDNDGNTYEIKSVLFRPRIVKIDSNGNELPLIKDPLGLWIHTIPFPVIGFLILTAVICLGMSRGK